MAQSERFDVQKPASPKKKKLSRKERQAKRKELREKMQAQIDDKPEDKPIDVSPVAVQFEDVDETPKEKKEYQSQEIGNQKRSNLLGDY